MEKLRIIIDGTSIFKKCEMETRKKIQQTSYGMETQIVQKMLGYILNLIQQYQPAYLCICFDKMEHTQLDLIKQVLCAIGITVHNHHSFETIEKLWEENQETLLIYTTNKKYISFVNTNTSILFMNGQFINSNYFPGIFPSQISDFHELKKYVSFDAIRFLHIYETLDSLLLDMKKMKKNSRYQKQQIKLWKKCGIKSCRYKQLKSYKREKKKEIFLKEWKPFRMNEENLEIIREILELE